MADLGQPDILKSYENIKSCIERESELVIKWLTMLILINAGLIAAIVQIYIKSDINIDREFLCLMLSILAIASCGFIFFAIDASSDQFEYLRGLYLSKCSDYNSIGLPRPFGDENEDKRTKMFPRPLYRIMGKPFIIPGTLLLLWISIIYIIGYYKTAIIIFLIFIIIFMYDKYRVIFRKFLRRIEKGSEIFFQTNVP